MGSQKAQRAAKPTGRNAQVVRILNVLRDLDQLGGMDLYELAERHGTSVRTIRRDLEALQEAGLPLGEESIDGKKKRWQIVYKDKLAQVSSLLHAGHYLALRVATAQVGPTLGRTVIGEVLSDLSSKVEAALGAKGRAQLDEIEACFYQYEKFAYTKTTPKVVDKLVGAIVARRLCQVVYRTPRRRDRPSTLRLLPLRLCVHDGALHLMCQLRSRAADHGGGLTMLNLQRVEGLKVLRTTGKPPADFHPEQLERAAFGVYSGGEQTTFVLRFTPHIAGYIRERIWHPNQVLKELRGGGVELTFTCSDSYEVLRWVASWRQWVEAIEPAHLRDDLAVLGVHYLDMYAEEVKPPRRKPSSKPERRRRV